MKKGSMKWLTIAALLLTSTTYAGAVSPAPHKFQAALFLKILAFNKNIIGGGDLTIHVVGDSKFAAAMKAAVGKKVGKSTIASVVDGADVPAGSVAAVYVSDPSKVASVTAYAQKNSVLSITGNPDLVAKGISLGVGVAGGKPKIMLNISSSKDEKINWNPAILRIALKVK
jgi:hypothetical protein